MPRRPQISPTGYSDPLPNASPLSKSYERNTMELHKDFNELLELFSVHGVEYVIVGGYALAYHGAPRFTGDLDLWVNPVPANADRIVTALRDFGFGSLNLTVEDFTQPDHIVQLGVPPVRVDIITAIDGVTWQQA